MGMFHDRKGMLAVLLVVLVMALVLFGIVFLMATSNFGVGAKQKVSGGMLRLGESRSVVSYPVADNEDGQDDYEFERIYYNDKSDDSEAENDEEDEPEAEEIIHCDEDDVECFVDAARTCSEADVTDIMTINLFGIEETAVGFYSLEKRSSDECILYMKNEKADVRFGEALRERMIESNMTEEEIEEAEAESNEMLDKLEGRDGECVFENDDLVNALQTILVDGDLHFSLHCDISFGEDSSGCEGTNQWEELGGVCEGDIFSSEFSSE